MNTEFPRTLSLLRQERGVSQRTAAGDLGISQALLSTLETNSSRAAFVVGPVNTIIVWRLPFGRPVPGGAAD